MATANDLERGTISDAPTSVPSSAPENAPQGQPTTPGSRDWTKRVVYNGEDNWVHPSIVTAGLSSSTGPRWSQKFVDQLRYFFGIPQPVRGSAYQVREIIRSGKHHASTRPRRRILLFGFLVAINPSTPPSPLYPHFFDKALVDEYPMGYARAAAYQTCDPNFLAYRRFGWLRSSVLLDLQDELQALEKDLRDYYFKCEKEEQSDKLKSKREDYESDSSRKGLIKQIQNKILEYDAFFFHLQKLHTIQPPSRRNQNNIWNIMNEKSQIPYAERQWICDRGDLAAIARPTGHTASYNILSKMLNFLSKRIVLSNSPASLFYGKKLLFRTRDQKLKTGTDSQDTRLISDERLDIFLRILLTLFASTVLLLPVLILFKLQPNSQTEVQRQGNYQLLTIFLFTFVFSACCSMFTTARRQEVFASAAAYCAVLVVFLGNSTNVMMVTNGVISPSGA